MKRNINGFAWIWWGFVCVALAWAPPLGGHAACRIDWDLDGTVTQGDYLTEDPMSGFYAEWYIFMFHPSLYPSLFPSGDPALLDLDQDGVIDNMDILGPLSETEQSEGFYSEWYIYMYYPEHYPLFCPESTCGQVTNAVLNWDRNGEGDLMGYFVHWGTSPGVHTVTEDVGLTGTPDNPMYVVEGLTPGTTYHFAVSAYDTSWNESFKSTEVSKSL